jgi:polyferredoxin
VENIYRLQVMNATEQQQTYRIAADGLPGLKLMDVPPLKLGPAEAQWVTLAVRVPMETAQNTTPGAHEIHFTVQREATPTEAAYPLREKSTFVIVR